MHIRAHKIHVIVDAEEGRERCHTELTAALSNNTLKWITNRDFPDEDRQDPDTKNQSF
jgi:hypothetical protein